MKDIYEGAEFGELSLITRKPNFVSVWTETEVHLAILEKDDYNRILKNSGKFILKLEIKYKF